jgi:hypothetical protein
LGKKAKSFEQFLVEYIATATVEQTQTALNFFTAIANQKIAAGSAPATSKGNKPVKTVRAASADTSSVTLAAA